MDLSKLPVGTGSATALLGLVLLLVLLGKLVPRSALDDAHKAAEDARKERDRQLEEKQKEVDLWRSAFLSEVSTTRELSAQNSQLMEVARVSERVLRSLPRGDANNTDDGSTTSGVV